MNRGLGQNPVIALPFNDGSTTLFRRSSMAVQNRIRSLRDKHASIDDAITKESARSLPDETRVSELKREKLRVKDAIVELSRGANP